MTGGGALLLGDGFATTPPPNAAAASATAVTPLSLPDPRQPGPYDVLTLTYGSGEDRHRPEYGADVALTTTSVNGADLLDGWSGLRQAYWGFGSEELPRNGRVWYPDGRGPFPLVMVVHGSHLMEDYSDAGYAYLGHLLASRGFIVASIDQNFLFSLLQPPLPVRLGKADFMNFLPLSAIVYQTFEFPLAAFVSVNPEFDPQTLSQVQFVFDRTLAGVVVLNVSRLHVWIQEHSDNALSASVDTTGTIGFWPDGVQDRRASRLDPNLVSSSYGTPRL